jgi:TetR/AcrR family transcriptional repressor of mexJK operon
MVKRATPGRPVDRDKDIVILAAAREILYRDGPQGLTMDAVASEAGVSKATVYSRHPNRQALVRSVIHAHGEEITAHFAVIPESFDDARSALVHFGRELLAWVTSDDHVRLMGAIAATRALAPETIREIYVNGPQKTLEGLAGWLEKAGDAGLIRCPRPTQSAEMFVAMLTGIDLVRIVYGLPCRHGGTELRAHVGVVVDAFLCLHQTELCREGRERKSSSLRGDSR